MKLPLACDATYYENFLSKEESAAIFNWICENCPDVLTDREIVLENGTVVTRAHGKIMFVDEELTSFSLFYKAHGKRIAWPPLLRALKDKVERLTGIEFSVCVCIYYKNGEEGGSFHTDLPSFGDTSFIPSISLGEQREFLIRRKSDHSEQFSIELADGSMIIMGKGFQDEYEHALPFNPKYQNPRINLTFRPFNWPADFERGRSGSG